MKRNKMMNADQTEADNAEQLPPMQEELRITDLETVRVVADPTRLRILELLVLEAQTVKRLAASLELPQTKLYYHINLLEQHGLIRVVGTRIVSGIIEKQYGAVAQSYRIDESLLALNTAERDDAVDLMLNTLLDGLRQDVRQGLAAGLFELRDDAADDRKITLARVPLRLTHARAAEFHRRLAALIEEYCPDPNALGVPAPGMQLHHFFVAFFPIRPPEE